MTPGTFKGIGMACLVVALLLAIFAWKKYDDNAKQVAAFNSFVNSPFGGNSPMGDMMGGMMKQMTGSEQVQAGMPQATINLLTGAVLLGIGGGVCLMMAKKKP